MNIGILSDTHDQFERTERAVARLLAEGAQVLFHCGDLIDPAMVAICAVLPCYFVYGNNDEGNVDEIRAAIAKVDGSVCLEWGGEVELAHKTIAMTHGHSHKDVRRMLATKPNYLFSGHSHFADDWCEGTTRRINPGALHRASSYSVAMLNLADDRLWFVKIPA